MRGAKDKRPKGFRVFKVFRISSVFKVLGLKTPLTAPPRPSPPPPPDSSPYGGGQYANMDTPGLLACARRSPTEHVADDSPITCPSRDL